MVEPSASDVLCSISEAQNRHVIVSQGGQWPGGGQGTDGQQGPKAAGPKVRCEQSRPLACLPAAVHYAAVILRAGVGQDRNRRMSKPLPPRSARRDALVAAAVAARWSPPKPRRPPWKRGAEAAEELNPEQVQSKRSFVRGDERLHLQLSRPKPLRARACDSRTWTRCSVSSRTT